MQEKMDETIGLRRDLGDGLVLRWATQEDTEALADFNARMHSDTAEPDEWIRNWTRQLMNGKHPTVGAGDNLLVVDEKAGGKIISTTNLISQTWAYEGISFKMGRPELVATDPAYRRKKLVRTIFEVIHARSAARGEMVQGITGIPWYYRQFGYEMALDLGGSRRMYLSNIAKLPEGQQETFNLRLATVEDMPLLKTLYAIQCATGPISRIRNEIEWKYELTRSLQNSNDSRRFFVIEDLAGKGVGYCEATVFPNNPLAVRELAILPGQSLRAVAEFLTRALKAYIEELNKERKEPLVAMSFVFGAENPLYEALGRQLEKQNKPYAWYIRVPDLPAFMRHIAPALEKRLVGSVMENHTGLLRLNFYRSQMTLDFENGKLKEVGTFVPDKLQGGDALFPDLTFLHLLFGHRNLTELNYMFPDCYADNERSAVLLETLFPKRPSNVIGLL